jgi:hypothetical protein
MSPAGESRACSTSTTTQALSDGACCPAPDSSRAASIGVAKGRQCSIADCSIAASALQELLPIMSGDEKLYKFPQSIPYPVEPFILIQPGSI